MAFSPLLFPFSPITQGGMELELEENLLAELGVGAKSNHQFLVLGGGKTCWFGGKICWVERIWWW